LLLLAVIVVIVAGFLTRRILVPRAHYLLTHRAPPRAAERHDDPQGANAQQPQPPDTPREELSDSDRRHLNDLINRKLK